MKRNNGNLIQYIVYTLLIIVFALSAIISFQYFSKNKEQIKVGYADVGNLDYKVYLKENNFFEKNYLESGSTYISSLIDYIDINYDYNMKYSKPLDGEYTYKVIATLKANKINEENRNYWTKEYTLDEKTGNLDNDDKFIFNDKIQIKYQDYIKILNDFKQTAGLSIDGVLKIDLIVSSSATYDDIKNPKIETKSIYSLSIPLTEASVNIELKKSGQSNSGTVNLGSEKHITMTHIIFLCVSATSAILFFIMLILLIIKIVKRNKDKSDFEIKLEKILTTYNSIIVNVDTVKDLAEYNIITVKTFEELLDAHSEVRMPINYVQRKNKEEAMFVLINEKVAWVYRLK